MNLLLSESQFLLQADNARARGLLLVLMILVLVLALLAALALARWAARQARPVSRRRREQTDGVDAWEESGRRTQADRFNPWVEGLPPPNEPPPEDREPGEGPGDDPDREGGDGPSR